MGLEGVKFANSIASLQNQVKGIFRVEQRPFIQVSKPDTYQQDTTFLFQYPDVYPKFVSPDRKSVCVFVALEAELPTDFNETVRKVTSDAGFSDTYFFGLSIAEDSYQQTLKTEITVLSVVAFVVVVLLICLSFRSFSLVVIAAVFLVIVNVLTLAVAQLLGATMNVLTVAIPAIVGIVSMSDLIHVYTRFREEKAELPFQTKISRTYKDLSKSLLLTSITTAIGFLSMLFTDIVVFTQFGLITAIGIFFALGLTWLLLPVLLFLHKAPTGKKSFNMPMVIYGVVENHSTKVLIFTCILTVLAVFYGMQVQMNTVLYDDLDADDPLSQSLAFFEENFFGIRDLELYVTAADGHSVYDESVLREIEKLQNYLHSEYGIRDSYSLITLLKRYNRAFYSGKPEKFMFPGNPVQLQRLLDYIQKQASELSVNSLVNEERNLTRIFVKTTDEGSMVANAKNRRLQVFIDRELSGDLLAVRISGRPLLIDRSNEQITWYLFKSLIGALVIILIILLWVYKSFRLAVIAFIPNLLPMLLMLALMYWLDITLKKSTAVVFTIAFGIAVDDTIHFISRFVNMQRKRKSAEEVLKATWQSTGKAILITSVVLIGGFGSFAFSSFQSTFLTGTLVSIALLGAVVSDLIILPALILRYYKTKK
ncbi:MAG: efflux RND transporter permease subunit [Bacteroidota bacterium]